MVQRFLVPALAIALVVAIVYVVQVQRELTILRQTVAERPGTATPRPSQATSASSRALTDDQRESMLTVLRSETGPVRKVWFQVEQNKPEPAAYTKALAQPFRDAGWEVNESGSGGLAFKPGISILVADEEWPSYASTAYDALQKAGIDVKAARGYRAYYEEQKREKPGWQGPKLAADQTYVVIVGPNAG